MAAMPEWVRLVNFYPCLIRVPSVALHFRVHRWLRFVIFQNLEHPTRNFEPRSERSLCFAKSLVPDPRDQRLVWIADSLELLAPWAIPKGHCRKTMPPFP